MKIRLYHESITELTKLNTWQTHYIFKVMRQTSGNKIYLFNQNDGEFDAEIIEISRNSCVCKILKQVQSFVPPAVYTTCIFSIIKPKNIELILQKCTEIGVRKFIPLYTSRSISSSINYKRLNSIAVEAAEQCGRIDIPVIAEVTTLKYLPQKLEGTETVLLHQNGSNTVSFQNTNRAIIVGPEGGFTNDELDFMTDFTKSIKISQNILRAETACIVGCGLSVI